MRASLSSEYQIELDELLTDPDAVDWDAIADKVAWLPPGSALWRSIGGPAALSMETAALLQVEFRLRVLDWRMRGSKGTQPKPPTPPEWAHERAAREGRAARKAEAFLRRQ